jgi:acetyltransferase-like isoleucine patch superfamily enzyme
MYWTPFKRIGAHLQRLVQTKFWGMDIHPTAQIQPTALIDRTWPKGIHIGADCQIEDEAVVLTHDLTRGIYLHTTIGRRSRIGQRAIILPGLSIGEDCIVMPGALVTRDMPPNSIAIGNPAKIAPRDENAPRG